MHFSDFQRILRSTPEAETDKKQSDKQIVFVRPIDYWIFKSDRDA